MNAATYTHVCWLGQRYGRQNSTHYSSATHAATADPPWRPGQFPRRLRTLCGRRWGESEVEIGGDAEPAEVAARPIDCKRCRARLAEVAR